MKGLELLFQAWCGATSNEQMTGKGGMVHKDAKDNRINCAIPWGEFTGRDVVLME